MANPGHSLQRFPISAPKLAITAAPDPFHWISLQPKGVRHGAAAGECRMGRDFGRRSRPWLREREGPAAQRWEGKHRRCAPVRSPCPQAEPTAETAPARRQSPRRTTQKVPTHYRIGTLEASNCQLSRCVIRKQYRNGRTPRRGERDASWKGRCRREGSRC